MNTSKNSILGLSLRECFGSLPDKRVAGRSKYALIEVIIIAICAILSGAQGWTQIAEFGKQKESWLKTFLALPHGIPSHDTFGDLFALISPHDFRTCFLQWVEKAAAISQGEIIAIDGKTIRRSHDKARGQAAMHLVHAFAVKNGLFLAQEKVADKSNEIKAIPPLLKLLELKGCIVTIDAMGGQKGIANLIKLREGDYVLAVKGNQGKLHKTLQNMFQKAKNLYYENMVYRQESTLEKDHGRVEQRHYCILPLMYLHGFKRVWQGLQTFIEVESVVYRAGKESRETRYYISSLPLASCEKIAEAIRKHWHVENRLHWCLDVSFREDDCRIRQAQAAENFSTLRKFVLNTFRLKEPNPRQGIESLRLKAAWNERYLAQLIGL